MRSTCPREAAVRHLLLGEAADPQVDGVDAGDGHAVRQVGIVAGAVQEVETILVVRNEFSLLRGPLVDHGASAKTSAVATARFSASVSTSAAVSPACVP